MLLRVIAEWICFAFVLVSLPIYLFLVAILLIYRNTRELKGAFFKLSISVGICDILSMFNNYIGYRFPSWGWDVNFYLNGGPLLVKLILMITWDLRMVQGMGATLIALNRATAVLRPEKYLKWWTMRTVIAVIGLQVLTGALFALPLSFHEFHWEIDNDSSMVTKFDDGMFKEEYFMAAFLAQTLIAVIVSACYSTVFISFHRKNNKVSSQDVQSSNKQSAQEHKLAIMGSIVCIFEILWFLFILYESVFSWSMDMFYLIYNTLTDIYSGINPYLLFLFSSGVRDRVKMVFGFKVKQQAFVLPSRAFGSVSPSMSLRTTPKMMTSIESNFTFMLPGEPREIVIERRK